jgi:uncharacterized membrane protein YqjE
MSTSSDETSSEPSLGTLVSAASRDLSTLIRAEIELAKAELRTDMKSAAKAAALLAVAGVFGFFVLIMLLFAFAEGLVALGLFRWAAFLVVAVVLLVLAGILALVARGAIKRVKPPTRTIETTKDTIAWAKHPTQPPVSVVRQGERTAETVPPGTSATP